MQPKFRPAIIFTLLLLTSLTACSAGNADDPQAPASGVYTVTMQEMSNETVTVPAGTFEAVKIQSTSTVDIMSVFAGADAPINFSGTTITWYAPGVGYVKSVENGGFGGEAFSTTTEFQSYNIP